VKRVTSRKGFATDWQASVVFGKWLCRPTEQLKKNARCGGFFLFN